MKLQLGPFSLTFDYEDEIEPNALDELRASEAELRRAWDCLDVSTGLRIECGNLLIKILEEIEKITGSKA